MRKLLVASVVVLLGLIAASPAFAKVHKLEAAGLSVAVPAKWKVTTGKHRLDLATRDRTLTISLTVIGGADTAAGLDATVAAVRAGLTDFEMGAAIGGTMGDLSGEIANAFGKLDGKPVEVLIAVLPTRRGNLLAMIAIGETGKYDKHDADLKKALGSFQATASVIEGDGFLQLDPDAQLFAERAARVIGKNDRKGFAKLADGALKKASKKAGKLTTLLAVPATGAWHVEPGSDASHFALWRGEPGEQVSYVEMVASSGVWKITASTRR